jgi:hypothetical protein
MFATVLTSLIGKLPLGKVSNINFTEEKVVRAARGLTAFRSFGLVVAMGLCLISQGQTATEIVKRSEEKIRGDHSYSEISIRIVRPTWEREISLRAWSLEPNYSLMIVDGPARDKGTVFLKRDSELWNYLPNINRNIKLPPSMMGQSWMGSDFSNDDLVRESSAVRDYTHELLGEEVIRGIDCYVIRFVPKPEAAVVWGEIKGYISKENYLQIRTDFFDEDGFHVNRMEGFDIRDLGGRVLPARMRMTPIEEADQYTEMVYKKLDFSVVKEPDFFSLKNIKRVR